ncbi:hypothetical protein F4806DRAFT_193127 [Annulohypoxylon nitens]|nr:hypothetical protein F4806DRAFT_193127 [Annulohypoxylon nitens]
MPPQTASVVKITALTILLPLGYVLFSPIIGNIRRRNRKSRQDGIEIIVNPPDAEFEIVAVHGLAADPEHTWEGVSSENDDSAANDSHSPYRPKKFHLLRDLLVNDFKKARIVSFVYKSDWLVNAPRKSPPEIGKRLLQQLMEEERGRKLPIVFIGHSFGGIIIKEALCASGDSGNISDNTKGIIFLGTPHQGSAASYHGGILASLTRFLGSDSTLLLYLQSHGTYLSDVEKNFRAWRNKQRELRIVSFYETMPTYILKWFPLGMIVDRDSATGSSIDAEYMDTNHSGMNKFAGREDSQYKKLREKINNLIPSDKPYQYICEKIYTEERLNIERLSSNEPLSMEQCYINLAIVMQFGKVQSQDTNPFSLSSRLKVETPAEEYQVELSTLFNPRKRPDWRTIEPRKIMIRGSAGIGKTTLCKKIVHDFIRGKIWKELFDRVIWVPLRSLKTLTSRKNLCDLFSDIYFWDHDGLRHAEALWDAIKDDRYCSRTLFLLDGLDEASEFFTTTLLIELLNKPSVIVTTRPHITLPRGVEIDVEFETIGFYPDQVNNYLETVIKDPVKIGEIQSFLQQHWLLQSLVRIPVQLDALCLIWSIWSRKSDKIPMLETMTSVYKAISDELWRKDLERLRKLLNPGASLAKQNEIMRKAESEANLLQHLAFTGLCNNVVEFNPRHRNEFIKLIEPGEGKVLDELLGELSFLRTSDSLADIPEQSYHFLHLTYQEFFAAQYFTKQFESGEKLEYLDFGSDGSERKTIKPIDFLLQNKYDVRYDIVWRFTVGLLKPKELPRFFEAIDEKTLDLLGPTHQRLISHCLSEKITSTTLQSQPELERKLAEWVLFGCKKSFISDLLTEPEFPMRALRAKLGYERVLGLLSLEYSSAYIPDEMIGDLEKLIDNADSHVKSAAIRAMWNRPNLPEETVENLFHLVENDKNRQVVGAAIGILLNQSTLPEEMITALLEMITEPDDETDSDGIKEEIARGLISKSNFAKETITTLITLLESKSNSWFRRNAFHILANQSDISEEIITAFMKYLPEESDLVFKPMIRGLKKVSNLSDQVIDGIILPLLRDADWDTREDVAEILAHREILSEKTMTALMELAEDSDVAIRHTAEIALGREFDLSNSVVEGLLQLIEDQHEDPDQHEDFGHYASWILHHQPHLSEKTLNALMKLVKHNESSTYVKVLAAKALGGQHNLPKEIVVELATLLKDEDLWGSAYNILSEQESFPVDITTDLVSMFDIWNVHVHCSIVFALKEIPLPEPALETLVKIIERKDRSGGKDSVARVLSGQSNLPDNIIRILITLLGSEEAHIRACASEALRGQSELPEESLKALVSLLEEDEYEVRVNAALTLGEQTKLSRATAMDIVAIIRNKPWGAASAVQKSPILLDKMLEAFGLSVESENLTEKLVPTIASRTMKSLYGLLLCRSFREQVYMYAEESTVYICYQNGSRISFSISGCDSRAQLLGKVRKWRRFWGIPKI